MAKHPLHDVAVVGVFNTEQARVLEGHTSESITLQAIRGVLDEAGLKPSDIDGVSAGGGGRSGTFGSAHNERRQEGLQRCHSHCRTLYCKVHDHIVMQVAISHD